MRAIVATILIVMSISSYADFRDTPETYLVAAEEGNLFAQVELGEYYLLAKPYQDYAEAVKWFKKAADQGYVLANWKLGFIYSTGGYGISKDYAEAAKWFLKAADQEDTEAYWNLGVIYSNGGYGITKDLSEAERWYRKGAEAGDVYSQFDLGSMYFYTSGIHKDNNEAAKWFRKAADQGHSQAQFLLGRLYANGFGVPLDKSEAVRWYRQAAEQGNVEAQWVTAASYLAGFGVPKNYVEAAKWLHRCAEQGSGVCRFKLGILYLYGSGVPQDSIYAYAWISAAAAADYPDAAEYVSQLGEQMTPEQLAQAQQLAARIWAGETISPAAEQSASQKVASGTCFAISPDGWLVTNHHVIDGTTDILIYLSNGQQVMASVLDTSPSIDLAILKVPVEGIDYLPLSKPHSAQLGQEVFTIGYPARTLLGDAAKFTDGTISALSGLGNEAALLQISVPIQPGNSGGPLVNDRGEVVGIVSSTAAANVFFEQTGTLPQNVNWAVKSDYLLPMIKPQPSMVAAKDRQAAIERTQRAACRVEAR